MLCAVTAYVDGDRDRARAAIGIAVADDSDNSTVQAMAAGIHRTVPVALFRAALSPGGRAPINSASTSTEPPPTGIDPCGGFMIPASQSPSRRLAWAVLARAALTAAPVVRELLRTLEVEQAAARLTTDPGVATDLPRALRDLAARDLDRAERLGIRLVTRDDAEWPGTAGLSELDAPGITDGSPVALWMRGTSRLIPLSQFTVAVVGARAASAYGVHVTHDLAGDLAERGWTVVSGGAFGIDAAAHRAALNRGGRTIAVVATGLSRAYPAAHRQLFDRIAETGLLISEYPPDTSAGKHQFLQRNRLVAALSSAVVIPECVFRGGTRNTANWARQLTRPVFAVPGPIYSTASTGCHELIRAGHARLVTDAHQILDDITSTPPRRTGGDPPTA